MNLAEIESEYERSTPSFQAMGDWVLSEICTLLKKQLELDDLFPTFLAVPAKSRVKAASSFLNKVVKKRREGRADPAGEIQDKVGIRLVVLRLADIELVQRTVESAADNSDWTWELCRHFDQEKYDEPTRFTYQSVHYVVTSNATATFGGHTIEKDTCCEIQIRTLLQHAYAEISHGACYKPKHKVTQGTQRRIERSLAKSSALIEATDEVFADLAAKLEDYYKTVRAIHSVCTQADELPSTDPSPLAQTLLDSCSEICGKIKTSELSKWLTVDENRLAIQDAREEHPNALTKDPILNLIAYLVDRHKSELIEVWPFENSYTRNILVSLGMPSERI